MAEEVKPKREELFEHYRKAKSWVAQSPFANEVAWQSCVEFSSLTERRFLREYAWVVLNSGFREAVVRKHFDYISLAFCDWESAREISDHASECIAAARSVFAHRQKLSAIVVTARLLDQRGFGWLLDRLREDPITTLESLPFIGRVTAFHLAKNLGIDVAKPDRHLVRIAKQFGYTDVQVMCSDIAIESGDRIATADIVLWRFAAEANGLKHELGGDHYGAALTKQALTVSCSRSNWYSRYREFVCNCFAVVREWVGADSQLPWVRAFAISRPTRPPGLGS